VKKTWRRSIKLLTKRDKRILFVVALVQSGLGFLDLIGVALIGVLGALSISGIQSKSPSSRVAGIIDFLHLDQFSLQAQVAFIGSGAALFLISRTLITVFFIRKSTYFLTRKSALISGQLLKNILSRDLVFIRRRSNQETLYAISFGLTSITVGIIGSVINLVSDFSVLFLITIGLFMVDKTVAGTTIGLFASIGFLIYKLQHLRAKNLGDRYSSLNIKSDQDVIESLNTFRELTVHGRKMNYANRIEKSRIEVAEILAELNFMPQISKYVIESTVILGALLICGIQFIKSDSAHAVAVLSVFLAAGSRIAPAVMRIQQGLITIKTSSGYALPTFELIDEISPLEDFQYLKRMEDFAYKEFFSDIQIKNLTFKYPEKIGTALEIHDLSISAGSHVALVGPSGSGKTTFADLLLGVLEPLTGSISISGYSPTEAIEKWPGAISYVPQDVLITNGNIANNIALGYEQSEINEIQLKNAIRDAQLEDLYIELKGSEKNLGEMGGNISGGQRQRIGIARALYTSPRLLVLDEATSSLDAETELLISERLAKRGTGTTVISVAHRLSTVQSADCVIYIDKGKIIAQGKFEEVRNLVPNFDHQANLMGL
jgi:ABC-type multidrug transport system fused ATPase/permease subunit